jgi:hypothetical protein
MHAYIIIASDRFQLSSWDYWDPFISKFLGTEPEISLIISNNSLNFSLPIPCVSFLPLFFHFCPCIKTLERVFQRFSSSNLENVFRNIYSRAKKEDWGVQKKNMGFGKRNFLIALI